MTCLPPQKCTSYLGIQLRLHISYSPRTLYSSVHTGHSTAVQQYSSCTTCRAVYYNSTRVHRCTPVLEVLLVIVVERVLSIDVRVHTHMIRGTALYSRTASTGYSCSSYKCTLNLTSNLT
jgi:hypothetical protein